MSVYLEGLKKIYRLTKQDVVAIFYRDGSAIVIDRVDIPSLESYLFTHNPKFRSFSKDVDEYIEEWTEEEHEKERQEMKQNKFRSIANVIRNLNSEGVTRDEFLEYMKEVEGLTLKEK